MTKVTENQINRANKIVAYYTLAATTTGAIPVPASSVAIVAENGIMISHIASALGATITIPTVIESIGFMGTANIVGRKLFMEGAKLLSWGTGSVWAMPALCGLGATTAGVQTYIVGCISIEIGKNGGHSLTSQVGSNIIKYAKNNYNNFINQWKGQKIKI
jgi:hypothetical protein